MYFVVVSWVTFISTASVWSFIYSHLLYKNPHFFKISKNTIIFQTGDNFYVNKQPGFLLNQILLSLVPWFHVEPCTILDWKTIFKLSFNIIIYIKENIHRKTCYTVNVTTVSRTECSQSRWVYQNTHTIYSSPTIAN